MPNHVKNYVEIIGSNKDIKKIIKFMKPVKLSVTPFKKFINYMYNAFILGYDPDNRRPRFFDFNNIVYRHEDLNITSDSYTNKLENNRWNTTIDIKELDKMKRKLQDANDIDRLYNFHKALNNLFNYGYASWYDWSIANWGTKWNAYNQHFYDDTFVFDTAWSNVVDLICKLSKKFPTVKIDYKYADENIGYNVGHYIIENGYVISDFVPEGGTKAAYELAFKLRPDYTEYYVFKNGNYEYAEED
jgi:hypothetical protein